MKTSIDNLKKQLEISERKRIHLQKLRINENREEDNPGFWIMLDLMTLLLIFFIMLYSRETQQNVYIDFPSVDIENQNTTMDKSLEDTIISAIDEVVSFKNTNSDPPLAEIKKKILDVLQNNDNSDYFVDWNQERLVIVLGENICFESAQADLLHNMQYQLKELAKIIGGKKSYRIAVSGHTDNTPISTDKFPSNWELSVARAVNTAKVLIDNGVDPSNVSIEGYGQYKPIFSNNSTENRKGNRRVEISLIKNNHKLIE